MNFEKVRFKHEFGLLKKWKSALYINVRDIKRTFSKFRMKNEFLIFKNEKRISSKV